MQHNKKYICKDGSRLPIPLSASLSEVERTSQLIHAEVEDASALLHHRLTLENAASAHLVLQNLLNQLLDTIRRVMGVDTVTVLLPIENSQQMFVCATVGLEEEITAGIKIPFGRGFAGRVAASCEPLLVDDLSTVEVVSPILRSKGLKSMLGVPLLVNDQVIGVFHVGTFRSRRFTKKDAQQLQLIAEHIGAATEHLISCSSAINECLALVPKKFAWTCAFSKLIQTASNFYPYDFLKNASKISVPAATILVPC